MTTIEEALEKVSECYNLKGCRICCDAVDEALTALRSGELVVVDGGRLDNYVLNKVLPCPFFVDPKSLNRKPECDSCLKSNGDCTDKARICIQAYLQRKDGE
ncbi:MAG: hypothetical protein GY852_00880 [bacterium]|nr:hypothetical protein [bacterium]